MFGIALKIRVYKVDFCLLFKVFFQMSLEGRIKLNSLSRKNKHGLK